MISVKSIKGASKIKTWMHLLESHCLLSNRPLTYLWSQPWEKQVHLHLCLNLNTPGMFASTCPTVPGFFQCLTIWRSFHLHMDDSKLSTCLHPHIILMNPHMTWLVYQRLTRGGGGNLQGQIKAVEFWAVTVESCFFGGRFVNTL